ncbi:MAG TPA: glycosyl hydrolase family 28-related protein, partial [Ilumatobacteraceae bacterium]|nr:glycosyl hydrolase family 28-related protein [Ilumatobacteraceae bacterium]
MDRRTTRRTVIKSAAAGVALSASWRSPAVAAPPSASALVGDAVVNVQAFGAVGDGVTDDTGAIVAAVAAAFDPASNARNHVFFPAGTYVVSQAIKLDYGIVIEGAGQAASIIRMNPSVLSSMFVGSGGFPVSIEFRNIQLDGGYNWADSKIQVPAASGSSVVSGKYLPGVFYQRIQIGASTVPVSRGDVLRTPGQPATFSTGAVQMKAGSAGRLYVPLWAPESSMPASTKWSIFRAGDLIANIGRLIVDNCALIGAKRHCIALPTAGEIRITRSKLGVSQGCGVFSDGAGDGAIANCWFMETGGANIYTYNATDFRFGQCLIEGGAVANVYSEWGQVKIASCDLWGGRAGNIVAMQSGWIRGVDLQLRDPGTGGVAGALGSTSWARPTSRPAVECHFADGNAGAVLTAVALVSASDNLGTFSPHSIVRIANGSRSNLAQIEFQDGITFAHRPIDDSGLATATRGCRGHVRAPVSVRTSSGADAVVVNTMGVSA